MTLTQQDIIEFRKLLDEPDSFFQFDDGVLATKAIAKLDATLAALDAAEGGTG